MCQVASTVLQTPASGIRLNALIQLSTKEKDTINFLIRMLRQNQLTNQHDLQLLGVHLYDVLFKENNIGRALSSFLQGSDAQEVDFLRIKLEFEENQTELEKWPWEYLFCPDIGTFLAARTDIVLIRHVPLKNVERIRSLLIDDPIVKILFVAASPSDLTLVQYRSVLDVLKELEKKKMPGKIKVTLLASPNNDSINRSSMKPVPMATFDEFVRQLTKLNPHVIHFIGHGRYNDEKVQQCGQLAFLAENGFVDWVDDIDFATRLAEVRPLRLVFLQACESADSNPYEAISGVTGYLAYQNIPALVAMQYKVENQIANIFAQAFYHALANYKEVDAAVQAGRAEIQNTIREKARNYAFGLPVLYLRGSGGLFPQTSDFIETLPARSKKIQGTVKDTEQKLTVIGGRSLEVHIPPDFCVWCGSKFDISDDYCANCGGLLVCQNCKSYVKKPGNFCVKCREPLDPPPKPSMKKPG
jgi:hypothetical protein